MPRTGAHTCTGSAWPWMSRSAVCCAEVAGAQQRGWVIAAGHRLVHHLRFAVLVVLEAFLKAFAALRLCAKACAVSERCVHAHVHVRACARVCKSLHAPSSPPPAAETGRIGKQPYDHTASRVASHLESRATPRTSKSRSPRSSRARCPLVASRPPLRLVHEPAAARGPAVARQLLVRVEAVVVRELLARGDGALQGRVGRQRVCRAARGQGSAGGAARAAGCAAAAAAPWTAATPATTRCAPLCPLPAAAAFAATTTCSSTHFMTGEHYTPHFAAFIHTPTFAKMTTWSSTRPVAGWRALTVRDRQFGSQLWLSRCARLPARVASTHHSWLSLRGAGVQARACTALGSCCTNHAPLLVLAGCKCRRTCGGAYHSWLSLRGGS